MDDDWATSGPSGIKEGDGVKEEEEEGEEGERGDEEEPDAHGGDSPDLDHPAVPPPPPSGMTFSTSSSSVPMTNVFLTSSILQSLTLHTD